MVHIARPILQTLHCRVHIVKMALHGPGAGGGGGSRRKAAIREISAAAALKITTHDSRLHCGLQMIAVSPPMKR